MRPEPGLRGIAASRIASTRGYHGERIPGTLRAAEQGGPVPGGRVGPRPAAQVVDPLADLISLAVPLRAEAAPGDPLGVPHSVRRLHPVADAAEAHRGRMEHPRGLLDGPGDDDAPPVREAPDL